MSEVSRIISIDHESWMLRCIELAGRGAGCVSPNPLVGAVLIDAGGRLLGEGWHRAYGQPHAERNAIEEVLRRHGADVLKDATLYVNLEPCSHYGKTPPCSDLVLEYRIPRVVVGMVDPNPAVHGIELLRARGIDVLVGVCEPACQRTNEAFTHRLETGRPLLTLKMAQTLDGRVATQSGHSRWVSGEASRERVHAWRASLDAVLVGANTARTDDPALTVRHVEGRQPWRVVLDREGVLPPALRLFTDEYAAKTIAVVADHACPEYTRGLEAAGGKLLRVPLKEGRLDLQALLDRLGRGEAGIPVMQSILVEAGPGLATALFEQNLVDRFYLFVAPKLVGKGVPALDGLAVGTMDQALTFVENTWEQVGEDMLFQGYRKKF